MHKDNNSRLFKVDINHNSMKKQPNQLEKLDQSHLIDYSDQVEHPDEVGQVGEETAPIVEYTEGAQN